MKIIYWSCPCVGLVRWLVGSLQIFLEVLFWMLSDVPHHYLRFETECHTDVHVHICCCQNENYLLVMSMCGTGQMTCRKPANIFRSTILDAKWCTTSLLVPHVHYLRFETECHTDVPHNYLRFDMYIFVPVKMKIIYWSCSCVGLVRWLVGSLQIFLEVLFWMLSAVPHHYLRFETECHTDRFTCTYLLFIGHVCQNENYLLV